nr:MAG TPA: hypothetical protein [Caudoviricetes sp.]
MIFLQKPLDKSGAVCYTIGTPGGNPPETTDKKAPGA